MNNHIAIAVFGLSLSGLPLATLAADAYVTANVSLRSGPDSSYPSVARLRIGTPVSLEGCVDGWAWCDVSVGDDHGWVSGTFLQQEYEGERLGIRSSGARIGIPVISFEFGAYWDDHYRNRSWYAKRERWSHVQPQYRVIEEHRGAREHERDGSHEHAREDSHNYSHGDAQGNAGTGNDAIRHGSHEAAEPSYPDRSANNRPAANPTSAHREHDDARGASRSETNGPTRSAVADQPRRDRPTNAQNQTRSADERSTAAHDARKHDPAQGNPAPVAIAARPTVQAHSVTPAQNKSVAPVPSEPAAKAREQERDDKDRR